MEFCKKLRHLRNEKGMSQRALADAVFVSRSAVAKWENGLGMPSEESLAALAKFFGVPTEFLRTDRPEMILMKKNKAIKRLSGSICAVTAAAVLAFTACALLHPVPYCASAAWDRIVVQPTSGHESAFEITDGHAVAEFVDALNSAAFRRSFRTSGEAPDHLLAVFSARGNDGQGDDLWLCSSGQDGFSVYIWTGTEELAACGGDGLGGALLELMESGTSCRADK